MAKLQPFCTAKFHGYVYEDLNISIVQPENNTAAPEFCERCMMENLLVKTYVQLCFECGRCQTGYFTKEEFCAHLRQSHSMKKDGQNVPHVFARCPKCRFYFIDESNFAVHMRRCHGLQNTVILVQLWAQHKLKLISLKVCKICSQETSVKNVEYCELCFKSVKSSFQKERHMDFKHPHCTKCNKWFAHTSALKYHEKKLHSTNVLACCYCYNNYATIEELQLHIPSHATDIAKQIEVDSEIRRCKACLGWLSSSRALLLHIEDNHIYCPSCHIFLTSVVNFRDHISIFHNFWPFMCTIGKCKIKFFQIKDLRRHMHQDHNIDLPVPYLTLEKDKLSDASKGPNPQKSLKLATSLELEKKLTIIFEHLLDWPLQMNLGVGQRKPNEIILSMLKVLDHTTAEKGVTKNPCSLAQMKDLLGKLLFNIMGKNTEFLWIFNCDLIELVHDIETVLLKHVSREELSQYLVPSTYTMKDGIAPMCGYCIEMFGSIEQLQSHIEHEHYYCPLCKRAVVNLKAFRVHARNKIHADNIWPITCYICGEKYWKLPELRWHMYIIHDIDYDTFHSYCADVGLKMVSGVKKAGKLSAKSFRQTPVAFKHALDGPTNSTPTTTDELLVHPASIQHKPCICSADSMPADTHSEAYLNNNASSNIHEPCVLSVDSMPADTHSEAYLNNNASNIQEPCILSVDSMPADTHSEVYGILPLNLLYSAIMGAQNLCKKPYKLKLNCASQKASIVSTQLPQNMGVTMTTGVVSTNPVVPPPKSCENAVSLNTKRKLKYILPKK